MSQLIRLKQRIKAISAIKKITQTMRLISMSSHSKLKKQSESMQHLKDEIRPLLCALSPDNQNQKEVNQKKYKTLYVIFAGEKGLCGNFNSNMFLYFNQKLPLKNLERSNIISVGKKASNYLYNKNIKPIFEFDNISPSKLETIAQSLYQTILSIHKDYESVICLYSFPSTFFQQEPKSDTIIPIQQDPCNLKNNINLDLYHWPQNANDVQHALFQMLLKINILLVLTNSMLSEQSARFLSMENATQSAENLLKTMKLSFNKLRQAKITRELIELISGF